MRRSTKAFNGAGILAGVRMGGPPQWLQDADAGKTIYKNPDGSISTVRTVSFDQDGKTFVAPTIRLIDGKPASLGIDAAIDMAAKNGDGIPFDSNNEAEAFAQALHLNHQKRFAK